jgi:ABC-type phosphate transport system ATPase subunit
VPEDRKLQGVFLQMSSGENITMNILGRCAKAGVLDFKKLTERANVEVKAMRVRTASLKQRAGGLSGGNQQKLLLARWLEINPRVLILDEPTRGVDVGAKAEIYALIQQLLEKGMAVLCGAMTTVQGRWGIALAFYFAGWQLDGKEYLNRRKGVPHVVRPPTQSPQPACSIRTTSLIR